MKILKFITASIALTALAASMDVSAHSRGGGGHWNGGGHWHGHGGHWHGHGHVGLFIGVPLGAPWYPYYPSVVTIQSPQPVYYVERNPISSTAPLPSGWWYYCPNPAGYYPYVQSCTLPWQPVEPGPPAAH